MRYKILTLLTLVAFLQTAYAQKKDKPKTTPATTVETPTMQDKTVLSAPVKVTSVEGITEYKLANGLRVLLFPDQSKQTVTVNITYLVGSKDENYGETGMAHLLEHLVFKGTPNHPNVPEELSSHGARPNGSTWYDRTNYFETFAATDENLKWALDLESDRMINSYISKKDLESEMTVVRNEFEMGENSPEGVLSDRIMSTAYLWHNYGKSTIGARADIENVPIDRLQAFYRKHYQPDNAVLLVAGKIDEAKTLDLINQRFGPTMKPARVIQPTYTQEPTQDGERTVVLKRTGDVQIAMLAYHLPSGSHADFGALNVLTQIMGSEPSGRLYKALVETKKASRISAYNYQLKDPGVLIASAQILKEKSLDDAKKTLISTFDEVGKTPFTQDEVDRAKNELIKQIDLAFNSSNQVGLQLSEYVGMGDWRLVFIDRDHIKAVTVADVNRVAGLYLKPDNRTVGEFIPTDKPNRVAIPNAPNVDSLVRDYKGTQTVSAGEAFDPSPANIESRTSRSTLPNGGKVALLSKKTRGEAVQLRLTFRFGNEKALANRGDIGQFTISMLDKGTAKHNRLQIKDEFDKLKANVGFFGGATQLAVNIETIGPNLPDVLKLVGEVVKEANFPADEFEKLKLERLSDLESQRSEPQSIAFIKIQKHNTPYPKSDPRYVEDFDESVAAIKALKLEELKQFHRELFGASNLTMAVVGDFKEAELKTQLAELFGNYKSATAYTRIPAKLFPSAAVNESVETPDKANAFFVASTTLALRDDNADFPALALGNYMLGGGFLNSRLAVRIRQKEGLSYGVGSQFNASSLDQFATFMAFAIYAPENEAKLEVAFKEEIKKVVTDGFTAEEVALAKSGFIQSRQVSRSQDRELAATLNNYLFLERTLQWDADYEKKINALTVEQVNTAMKKNLNPESISIVKAGDFAKSKK